MYYITERILLLESKKPNLHLYYLTFFYVDVFVTLLPQSPDERNGDNLKLHSRFRPALDDLESKVEKKTLCQVRVSSRLIFLDPLSCMDQPHLLVHDLERR